MRLCVAAAAALMLAAPAAPAEPVDLEIVFAVDTSRSMDRDEQLLQREGFAAALTDPAVLEAIRSGPGRRIAIAYLEWGGPGTGRLLLGWTVIAGPADAEAAAAALRAAPFVSARGTSISAALLTAAALIDSNGFEGLRRVIDISGDGPNNMGPPVDRTRDALVARGFEVNGLPLILNSGSTGVFSIAALDAYFEDCVIGGPGAFVVPVLSIDGFAAAIRQKMVMEIAALAPPPRLRPAAMTTDCEIGEKLRQQWMRMQDGG
jgi:hypothetical protein